MCYKNRANIMHKKTGHTTVFFVPHPPFFPTFLFDLSHFFLVPEYKACLLLILTTALGHAN